MLSLYRTLSLRYVGLRRARSALIVACIMVGVASLVGTRVLNETMSRASQTAANPLAGTADLMITKGDLGVPGELVHKLRDAQLPSVREVTPLIVSRVLLADLNNRSVWLFGADLDLSRASGNRWSVEPEITDPLAGFYLRRYPPVLISSGLAQELPAAGANGQELRIRAAGGERGLAVAGRMRLKGDSPIAALGENLLGMTLRDAGRLLYPDHPDHVTRIDIAMEPGADLREVRRRVEEEVGGQGDVMTPADSDSSLKDITAGLELGFALGGVGALVVGLFLIYLALSVSVAERRHDIGILRSLGATRLQVAGLFAGEAALLGLTGSALGIPLGLLIAHALVGPVQQVLTDIFMPLETRQLHLGLDTVLLALGAGVATSLLAALVPALSAASEEPADAVRRAPPTVGRRLWLLQGAASTLLIAAGATGAALPDTFGRAGIYGGLALILVGALAAMPLLTAVLSRLLLPLARQLLGVESRLAADNLTRSATRTGLVVGALAAGVLLLIQTAGVTFSSEDAVLGWVDQRLPSDLFASANGPITAGGTIVPMSDKLAEQIADDPELSARVEKVLPVRLHQLEFRGKRVFLIAFEAAEAYEVLRRRSTMPSLDLYPRLKLPRERLRGPAPCLVSDNFAALYDVSVGDRLTLAGKNHPVEVEVIGTILDYTWNRGTLLVDRQWYLEHFEDPLVDLYHVYVRRSDQRDAAEEERNVAEVRQALLRKWGKQEALVVLTRKELREGIRELLRRLYGLAMVQEMLVALVASLGVVMAQGISVLQRRRELGLLRAVGATRAQVLRSVLAEAVLMGLIGTLVGVAVGVPVEHYVIKVILLEEAGFTMPVLFPWSWAGLIVVVTLATATLAGLGPALRAMRQSIPEAIAYE
jgi:putative ABC transport system permease protein